MVTLPNIKTAYEIAFDRGKQIFRDRQPLDPDEMLQKPGIVIGFMWQAGFEHAYDGFGQKFTESAYQQGYSAGQIARRRYRG